MINRLCRPGPAVWAALLGTALLAGRTPAQTITNDSLVKRGFESASVTTAQTYGGTTLVEGGTLTFAGAGTALNTVTVSVAGGAAIQLDNTGTNVGNRLSDTALVILRGGYFDFAGSSSAASAETTGSLIAESGFSSVTVIRGGSQTATLTFDSLFNGTGTVQFVGGGADLGGANRIFFASAPDLTNGILPYAVVANTAAEPYTFASYGATNGVAGFTAYAASFSGSAADTVKLTAASTVSAATTRNALVLAGAGLTLNANLTLSSGGLISYGTNTVGGTGTLTFGGSAENPNAAYIFAEDTLTITAPVSAPVLTTSGYGTVVLGNTTSAAEIRVNSGTLRANVAPAVAAANIEISAGGTLDVSPIAGGFTLATGKRLQGAGTVVGTLSVPAGATISPRSVGTPAPAGLAVETLNLAGGGSYEWSFNAPATAGSAAETDPFVSGKLTGDTLNLGGASAANRILLKVTSLRPDNEMGAADPAFAAGQTYRWQVASFGTITGAAADINDQFTIDAAGFADGAALGTNFSLSRTGGDIYLSFTPVPEPGLALAAAGLGVLGTAVTRRYRRTVAVAA